MFRWARKSSFNNRTEKPKKCSKNIFFQKEMRFLLNFQRTRRMQFWQASWKTFIKSFETSFSKSRENYKKTSDKHRQNFFWTRGMQIWQTCWKLLIKSSMPICSKSKKFFWKIFQKNFRTSFNTRWRRVWQPWRNFLTENQRVFDQLSILLKDPNKFSRKGTFYNIIFSGH